MNDPAILFVKPKAMSDSIPKLDDAVELDPNVDPADVERALVEAVNLGWRQAGNEGRCNVPANFVAWALQEIERLREIEEAYDQAQSAAEDRRWC